MGSLLSILAGTALATGAVLLVWLVFSTADELFQHGKRGHR